MIEIAAPIERHLAQRNTKRVAWPVWLWLSLIVLAFGATAHAQTLEQPVESTDSATDTTAYRLGPGDRIEISVFNQADLSGEISLDEKGRFSMPLIGSVDASDLTSSELEVALVNRLKPDYLVNPRVYVRVMTYRPYYLIGEVLGTGAFPYIAGMSYLKAIAISGGFTYRAKQDHVFVIRADDPEQEEIKLDVDEKVQPGDIIRIAERLF